MIPHAYRTLLTDGRAQRLLSGLGVSSLGDGMSTVTIAWLAVRTAPAGKLGLFVGLAVAAYTLPAAIGALALGRYLRHRPARALVLAHCLLRTGFLGTIAVLAATGTLSPVVYIALLAGSSLLASWGIAGQYTMLAELGGDDGRLAANSLASAQVWLATIIGPALAGLLLSRVAPDWLLAFDAASFAFLGAQAWRTHAATTTEQPIGVETAESGFRVLRRHDLLGLIVLTWLFFFLYGPVEDALPVYVAHDLHAHARLLGAYWTSFGVGALASTLFTGMVRSRATRRVVLVIVAGWGACLVPFAFAPVGVTLVCFALGGIIYGPSFRSRRRSSSRSPPPRTCHACSPPAAPPSSSRPPRQRTRRPHDCRHRSQVDARHVRRRNGPPRSRRSANLATSPQQQSPSRIQGTSLCAPNITRSESPNPAGNLIRIKELQSD